MTTRLNQNTVEIGSLTYTQRDALTSVQAGTIAYISDSEVVQVYDGTQWNTIGDQTTIVSASGGNATDTSSRPGYTTHIFTSPGTLTVSSGYQDGTDAVVVGGGGGGAVYIASGGGAGGMRIASFTLVPGTYEIQVGGGGARGPNGGTNSGKLGTDSYIRATSGGVGFSSITGSGGGGGGGGGQVGQSGGSGGGMPNGDPSPFPGNGPSNIATEGAGNAGGDDPRCTPVSEGQPGGWTPENGPFSSGNGGGGAGEIGTWGAGGGGGQPENQDGGGGDGLPVSWAPPSYGTAGPSPGRWFAGGGGGAGGQGTNVRSPGGTGGGASGANTIPSRSGSNGQTNCGGGGGGGWAVNPGGHSGGTGGPGIVMISYPSPANL